MSLVELILDIITLISDIHFGRRYGFGGLLWSIAGFLVFVVAVICFAEELYILCVIGVIAFLVCTFFSIRCDWRNIKKAREAALETHEQEAKEP